MTELFKTIHGSHLYGLDHAGSDQDWFSVVSDKIKTTHKIIGDQDVTVLSLDKFLYQAGKGNPQSLEAMFSPFPQVDEILYLRSAFRPNIPEAIHTYGRTIRNFSFGSYKQQRHAIRLALNINDLYRYGRFNPRLSGTTIFTLKCMDQLMEPDMLIKSVSTYGIDFTKEQ